MGTLGRYWALRTARIAGAWALALLALYLGVDLADRGASGGWPLAAWPLRLPTALAQTLPFAALGGAAHALVHLVRSGEWTAARAVGVPPRKLLRWILTVPAVLGVLAGGIAEWVAPVAAARWARVSESPLPGMVPTRPPPTWTREGNRLVRHGDDPLAVELARTPRIVEGATPDAHPDAAVRPWPAAGTLRLAALRTTARAVESTGHDASVYRAEMAFRPLLAASTWLLPWVALPFGLRAVRRSAFAAAAVVGALALATYLAVVLSLHAARAGAPAGACAVAAVGTLVAVGLVGRWRV